MDPHDVAPALDGLHRSGKVRHIGVSNHTPAQIDLLKEYVGQPIVANQVQLGLGHPDLITDGMDVTHNVARGPWKDRPFPALAGAGTIDYCRRHAIQVQAWAPLSIIRLLNGASDGGTPEVKQLARLLADLAQAKGVTPSAIALAWLLRHPAGILPVIGATNPVHVSENCAADEVILDRDEWYRLFTCAGEIQAQRHGPGR
jgi:predicted oxidoreductase